ncbi:MAG: hypothetical protein HY280_09615 [Nitrospinae bacterium]|nr:hypothetical protein [Nitrospinota bacterium]
MTVDTLKLYERLNKVGMSDALAKEVAEVFKETNEALADRLATKEDLEVKIATLKFELIKWMLGIGVAGTLALLGILPKLIR